MYVIIPICCKLVVSLVFDLVIAPVLLLIGQVLFTSPFLCGRLIVGGVLVFGLIIEVLLVLVVELILVVLPIAPIMNPAT